MMPAMRHRPDDCISCERSCHSCACLPASRNRRPQPPLCQKPHLHTQLEELRAAVKRVLEARHGAELHGAVLQELKGSYAAGPGGTDFGAAISGRSTALAEATP